MRLGCSSHVLRLLPPLPLGGGLVLRRGLMLGGGGPLLLLLPLLLCRLCRVLHAVFILAVWLALVLALNEGRSLVGDLQLEKEEEQQGRRA